MKRYIKPGQTALPKREEPVPIDTGFDIVDLLQKGEEILRREISNLMIESTSKKLSPNSSKDLVAYLKLLNELKIEQQRALSELTDDELGNIAE